MEKLLAAKEALLQAQEKIIAQNEALLAATKAAAATPPAPAYAAPAALIDPDDEGPPVYPRGDGLIGEDLLPTKTGAQVGIHQLEPLPDGIRKKILADAYVDFAVLVPQAGCLSTPAKSDPEGSQVAWEPKPKRSLSMNQWWKAYARYTDAFLRYFPSAARDLNLYGALIRSIMDRHDDVWFRYDERFRRARKAKRLPYCAVDKDLLFTLEREVPGPSAGPGKTPKGAQGRPNKELACFDFNSGNCTFTHCRYGHFCAKCGGAHADRYCKRSRHPVRGRSDEPGGAGKNPKLGKGAGAGSGPRS